MTETLSKNLAQVVLVKVDKSGGPFELVLNRGAEHGVKVGDKYLVYGYGEEIVDPSSGENLGTLELVRGRGEVIHVQEKISTIRSIERRPSSTKRIIRKNSALYFGTTEETEIPEAAAIPFENAYIGDQARLIANAG